MHVVTVVLGMLSVSIVSVVSSESSVSFAIAFSDIVDGRAFLWRILTLSAMFLDLKLSVLFPEDLIANTPFSKILDLEAMDASSL